MSYTHIPYELESEILSRVPVMSLGKLKFTCKRWFALFKDPIFIQKINSGKATNQAILWKNHKVYSVSINPHGFHDPPIELTCCLKSLKDSEHVMISYVFHCDGLLLCFTKDYKLAVWNPCTGQTRWIQAKPLRGVCYYQNYFLGKSRNDDYKILSYNNYYNEDGLKVVEYEIYEFSSDSWRILNSITHELCTMARGVSLKGNTYWFQKYADDDYCGMNGKLIRFDYTTERFEHLLVPFHADDEYERTGFLSVVKEDKLAFLHRMYPHGPKIKIMVSNTITDEAKELSATS